MKHDFKIYFRNKKQWIEVYLEDVSPKTFKKHGGGRWGYFLPTWEHEKDGIFGEIHFVKSSIRLDTVAHEVFHAVNEWAWSNGEVVTRKNEEFYAKLDDEIFRKIELKLKKLGLI